MPPVTVDLIAQDPSGGYALILVEEGPWAAGTEQALCANVSETVYPSGITVEGDQGAQHEFASRCPKCGR